MKHKKHRIFDLIKNQMSMSVIVKLLVFLVLNANVVQAQETSTYDIKVTISGLDNNKGRLLVGLYNSEESFLDTRFQSIITEISNKKGQLVFKDIPEGIYAVSFIHDENGNGKMDTNFLGIPKEDYGCSNNARGTMGPPKWKDAKFELKQSDKIIDIKL